MREELELCRQNHDIEGEVRALGNLAVAARDSGRLSESISCLRDQIRASRSLPEQQSQAALILAQLTNTEMALQTLEKFGAKGQSFIFFASKLKTKPERKSSLEKAVSVGTRTKDNDTVVHALLTLGQVLLELKDYKESIEKVEKARTLIESKTEHVSFSEAQRNSMILQSCATLTTCYR
jgi:tetratricopeptide (TPR) repeat protein